MQIPSDGKTVVEIAIGIFAAGGATVQFFGAYILSDLRNRVERIENILLNGKPSLTYKG